MARYEDDGDLEARVESGRTYVVIFASHTDKPSAMRVRVPARPLETAKDI